MDTITEIKPFVVPAYAELMQVFLNAMSITPAKMHKAYPTFSSVDKHEDYKNVWTITINFVHGDYTLKFFFSAENMHRISYDVYNDLTNELVEWGFVKPQFYDSKKDNIKMTTPIETKLTKLFVIWINQFSECIKLTITAYQTNDEENMAYLHQKTIQHVEYIESKLSYYQDSLPESINPDELIANLEESLVTLEMVSQYQSVMVNPQTIYNYTKQIESEYAQLIIQHKIRLERKG